ncbi:MAG: hypothetical protein H0V24_15025 [Chloroflexia bacterium]|nr:hypothetical protein [Chloroflexia bacterium]
MTELCTLHLLDPAIVARYVAAVTGQAEPETVVPHAPEWSARIVRAARVGYERAGAGQEQGANIISYGLAQALAASQPSYLLPRSGLSAWEARVDRGLGMLMRPPSRLFGEAGLPVAIARAMPIRVDFGGGMMGGAHIPARLIPELQRLLDSKAERLVRRLVEAELDGVALLGLYIEAAEAAAAQKLGLYEAIDVIIPEAPDADPPGTRLIQPDQRRLPAALRQRLEDAAKPPKKPGLMARLLKRAATSPG